jgi:hypothetical protein
VIARGSASGLSSGAPVLAVAPSREYTAPRHLLPLGRGALLPEETRRGQISGSPGPNLRRKHENSREAPRSPVAEAVGLLLGDLAPEDHLLDRLRRLRATEA